jgi:enoyl-CoA hydratase/carnithine racemase
MNSDRKLTSLEFLHENQIAVLTLKAHTFSKELVREIVSILDQLETGEGPMCLITTCSHPKIYSAGINFTTFELFHEDIHNFIGELCRLFGRMLDLPFPSIAAINGHTLAGGFMFAMSHDWRIMVDGEFTLGMTEINLGMTIPPNMMAPLLAKLNQVALRKINLFGEKIMVDEALKLHVVDEKVSKHELLSYSIEKAKAMSRLANNRIAYRGIKVSLYKPYIEQAFICTRDAYSKSIMKGSPKL